jgi:hypothetical protein
MRENKSIKLPIISIPVFEGLCEQWLEFRDTFLSLVHNSNQLSNIEKFHYLKSSLRGSAVLVIDSVEFSSDNYLIAWELLLNRYNNSRLLVHSHVKSLFTLQNISKESPIFLRRLTDTVLKNLRALKVLGEPTESWDTLIIYIMVSKLDSITEREWEQYKGMLFTASIDSKIHIKVDDLISFLNKRADMLETLQLSHNKSVVDNKKYQSQNQSKFHCNVSTNKPPERHFTREFKRKPCLLCNSDHPIYSCQKFIDCQLESKLKFIRDFKLCINCLRTGHSVETCRFGPCRFCNKKHNSLVHSDNHSNASDARPGTRQSSLGTAGSQPAHSVTPHIQK